MTEFAQRPSQFISRVICVLCVCGPLAVLFLKGDSEKPILNTLSKTTSAIKETNRYLLTIIVKRPGVSRDVLQIPLSPLKSVSQSVTALRQYECAPVFWGLMPKTIMFLVEHFLEDSNLKYSKTKTFCKRLILNRHPKVSQRRQKYSENSDLEFVFSLLKMHMKFHMPRDKELGRK